MPEVIRCFGCGKRLSVNERNQLYDPEPNSHGELERVDAFGCNQYPDCIDQDVEE